MMSNSTLESLASEAIARRGFPTRRWQRSCWVLLAAIARARCVQASCGSLLLLPNVFNKLKRMVDVSDGNHMEFAAAMLRDR
jgi:hypothetical protein